MRTRIDSIAAAFVEILAPHCAEVDLEIVVSATTAELGGKAQLER